MARRSSKALRKNRSASKRSLIQRGGILSENIVKNNMIEKFINIINNPVMQTFIREKRQNDSEIFIKDIISNINYIANNHVEDLLHNPEFGILTLEAIKARLESYNLTEASNEEVYLIFIYYINKALKSNGFYISYAE